MVTILHLKVTKRGLFDKVSLEGCYGMKLGWDTRVGVVLVLDNSSPDQ